MTSSSNSNMKHLIINISLNKNKAKACEQFYNWYRTGAWPALNWHKTCWDLVVRENFKLTKSLKIIIPLIRLHPTYTFFNRDFERVFSLLNYMQCIFNNELLLMLCAKWTIVNLRLKILDKCIIHFISYLAFSWNIYSENSLFMNDNFFPIEYF